MCEKQLENVHQVYGINKYEKSFNYDKCFYEMEAFV